MWPKHGKYIYIYAHQGPTHVVLTEHMEVFQVINIVSFDMTCIHAFITAVEHRRLLFHEYTPISRPSIGHQWMKPMDGRTRQNCSCDT